jgi:molybdopterin molybdotransferase
MPGFPLQSDRVSSVDEHVERILEALTPLQPYDQPLLEALGLPVCEDISAPMDLPAFDNSAMDGYAVCFDDVATATEDHPVHLPVVGEMAAGQTKLFALSPGTTVRIMTGAPIPQGSDAVVPVEWTDGGVAAVRITKAPTLNQHVRRRGEDVLTGDVLLEDGTVLGPRQLGLLASVGRSQVRSRPRPRVVIISTGSELREPGTQLSHDSVYDANSYMLAAAARSAGAIAYRVGIVSDDPQEFSDALSDQLVRADMVVTSGGVSKGTYDVVKETLSELGTVHFGEVAMQPGKPQGFGLVGPASGGPARTPLFALPGNPVSAYVSFELFVRPALRAMAGHPAARLHRPRVTARLAAGHSPLASPPGKRQFLRGVHEPPAPGEALGKVRPVGGPSSHLIAALAQADALIDIPEAVTEVPSGMELTVVLLD